MSALWAVYTPSGLELKSTRKWWPWLSRWWFLTFIASHLQAKWSDFERAGYRCRKVKVTPVE